MKAMSWLHPRTSTRSPGALTLQENRTPAHPAATPGSPRSIPWPLMALSLTLALGLAAPGRAQHRYQQTNLVSDVPDMAATTDASLVNPWGLAHTATSP